MTIRNRSGFLQVGFLAVDIRLMIIQVACGVGMIPLPITAVKEKPIIHTSIPITTTHIVHTHTIINTTTTHIPIIGIHTHTMTVTGGLENMRGA